jgi:hypothetical protein
LGRGHIAAPPIHYRQASGTIELQILFKGLKVSRRIAVNADFPGNSPQSSLPQQRSERAVISD